MDLIILYRGQNAFWLATTPETVVWVLSSVGPPPYGTGSLRKVRNRTRDVNTNLFGRGGSVPAPSAQQTSHYCFYLCTKQQHGESNVSVSPCRFFWVWGAPPCLEEGAPGRLPGVVAIEAAERRAWSSPGDILVFPPQDKHSLEGIQRTV